MKKIMLVGLLALSTAASVAFAMQSNGQTKSAKNQSCRKVILTCPNGGTYYKCVLGDVNSPDCYSVGLNKCNITEYPCRGPVFP